MLRATLRLSADLARKTDPLDVIDLLDHTAEKVGMKLFGAWRLATVKDDWDAYRLRKNVFWHPRLPAEQWEQFLDLSRQNGPSVLTQIAWRNEQPFTFTEGMQRTRPSGKDRWIIDWHNEHGRRDGFYCPCGRWNLIYESAHVIRISAEMRGLLSVAAHMTTGRLEQIIRHKDSDDGPELTARELAILRHLSFGRSIDEIARDLAISVSSCKTYLARAQTKLNANGRVHAVAEAIRRSILRLAPSPFVFVMERLFG